MHAETFDYWLDLVTEKENIKQWIDSDDFPKTEPVICKAKIQDLREINMLLKTLEPAVLNKGA